MNWANNRLHRGAQKPGGLGNNNFIIKRAPDTVRIVFVPCEAARWANIRICHDYELA